MKLEQIRRNGELVAGLSKLMEDPHFKVLMEMLEDENPGKVDLGFGTAVFDIARLHDRRNGYELAIANLKRSIDFIPPNKPVPQDYEK
jgi:hypothetical protein